jgi:hypothetical protein
MDRMVHWRNHVMIALTAPLRWIDDHLMRWHGNRPGPIARWWRRRHRPGLAGVREPRRPRPTLPAAAVALAEPRTELRRRIRLRSDRDI